ncbi:ABC transporter permease [Photobacterium sp. DNB23_23_1]
MTDMSTKSLDLINNTNVYQKIKNWLIYHPIVFPILLIVIVCIVVGAISPSFWQMANVFDILRASAIRGLFALGVLVVLASGGLEVSFTSVAALVMYSVTMFVTHYIPGLSIVPILAMGALGGTLLGMINGLLVNTLKAPSLIITIGTQYAFRGFLLTFIGTALFMNIPSSMEQFGQITLITMTNDAGFEVKLPAYVLVLLAATLLTWYILNRTLIGRAIYAVGGNPDIAERLGFKVAQVQLFVFAYAGFLAGIAGILHVSSNRLANPFDLAGTELAVIAAVVLGGARITGGSGTVGGTILGVILITLVSNVLILVGIPSTWQTAILGSFILIAGLFFSFSDKRL